MIGFVIGLLVKSLCLSIGAKLTGVEGNFLTMFAIAAISSTIAFIPVVGFILGIISMFVLLVKWTGADFWPDAVLLVVVSNLVAIGVSAGLVGMLR